MEPIHLAFLWHQHQPFYKNLITGRYHLPWVRLHAIKDYIGMLLVLKEFPNIKATINLVPSLLVQIEEYAAGHAEDESLRLTKKPPEELSEAERRYILENLFLCNADQIIHPFPRFNELFCLRNEIRGKPALARKLLSPAALRDIQVWGTLAWFHPLVVENDPTLKELHNKGRDFTEADKAAMLERQDAVIRKVIPLHQELVAAGQIELTTTPFYHPILPLLCHMESARMAMPDVPMPERRSDMCADAETQLQRAIDYHTRLFGRAPTGIWPAEGSVSEEIVPLLQGHGIRWIATDEAILKRSAEVQLDRDNEGNLLQPDDLHQPYRLPGEGDTPAIVFRDQILSDAIGFQYHHGEAAAGARHFVDRIKVLAERCKGRPRLITVILDGENPWDYYDQAGTTFLRALYENLAAESGIITTCISEYIAAHPPEKKLEGLHAGSWIDANFSIWIGAEEDRKAWCMVADAREAVLRKFGPPNSLSAEKSVEERARLAWEEIAIAQGSDWYWWFGEDRNSFQDYMFDALFRAHLSNVYTLLEEPAPPELEHPVGGHRRHTPWNCPEGTLHIKADGHATTLEEWLSAGHYSVGHEASAMRRSGGNPVNELFFGFGDDAFCVRLDGDLWGEKDAKDVRVVFHITKPEPLQIVAEGLLGDAPAMRIIEADGRERARLDSLAVGDIFECVCPLIHLAAKPGDKLEFFLEVALCGSTVQRLPQEGTIEISVSPVE